VSDSTPTPLTMVGSADAAVCVGDVCVIPEHPEHAIVARRLDEDRV
jgi:hypothetical protein